MRPGVITDYNCKLLSEALPLLSCDWPHLSFFFFFLFSSTSFGIPSHVNYLLS